MFNDKRGKQSVCLINLSPDIQQYVTIYFSIFRSIGWRLGLQALTGIIFTTFILGKNCEMAGIKIFIHIILTSCGIILIDTRKLKLVSGSVVH